jgi:hypothetical protein
MDYHNIKVSEKFGSRMMSVRCVSGAFSWYGPTDSQQK